MVELQLGRCLDSSSHSVHVAVAVPANVVGYVAVHWLPYLILPGPEGFVSELFVASDTRWQGVGTRLLEVTEAEAIARGCSRLQLINFRDRESYERRFYEKRAGRSGRMGRVSCACCADERQESSVANG